MRPLVELDARRQQRGRELEHTPAPDTLVFHPPMAEATGERVTRLIKGLGSAEGVEETKKALRALLERIVLAPAAEGPEKDLPLEGYLAGLLPLAAGAQGPNVEKVPDGTSEEFDMTGKLVLAARAGDRLTYLNSLQSFKRLAAHSSRQLGAESVLRRTLQSTLDCRPSHRAA